MKLTSQVWDIAFSRVGIGGTPSFQIHLVGSISSYLFFNKDHNGYRCVVNLSEGVAGPPRIFCEVFPLLPRCACSLPWWMVSLSCRAWTLRAFVCFVCAILPSTFHPSSSKAFFCYSAILVFRWEKVNCLLCVMMGSRKTRPANAKARERASFSWVFNLASVLCCLVCQIPAESLDCNYS